MFERSTAYRGSVGRSIGNAPSYNGENIFLFNLLSFSPAISEAKEMKFMLFYDQ